MLKLADLQEVCGNIKRCQAVTSSRREYYLYYFSVGGLKIKAHRTRESDTFWTINFGFKFKDYRGKLFEEFFSSKNYVYDKEYLKNIISQLNPQNYEYRPFSINELFENSEKIGDCPNAFKDESNLAFKVDLNLFLLPQEYLSFFEKTNWKLTKRDIPSLQKQFNITNPTLVKNIFLHIGMA